MTQTSTSAIGSGVGSADQDRHALDRRRGQREGEDGNVGVAERTVSAAAGTAMIGAGLRKGGVAGLAMVSGGVLLLFHGSKRHSRAYEALGVRSDDASTWSHPLSREVWTDASVTIRRTPAELYEAWRDIEKLQAFFPHIESVEQLGGGRSRWKATLPAGPSVTWIGVITEDNRSRRISWESGEESPFRHTGRVSFRPLGGGESTQVDLEMHYHLPAGVLGLLAAKAQGVDPQSEAADALRRFKRWAEQGGDGRQGESVGDRVDEASEDSFPASDPPSYTGATATPSAQKRS